MTTNNDTYKASVKSAETTKVQAVAAAVSTHLSAITAVKNDVGYREGFPTGFATFDAGVKAANLAKLQAFVDAERAKQAAVQIAKDLLHSQGEQPT